jgi:hypothetical protein
VAATDEPPDGPAPVTEVQARSLRFTPLSDDLGSRLVAGLRGLASTDSLASERS